MRHGTARALALSALLLAGCRAAANTPRGTAERFLDAHYVRIDLPAALEFTADLARHKVENEMRLVPGPTNDATTRKTSVDYPLGAERVGFTIRGGAGVTLAGVSIAEERGLGSQDPFLTAREIELRLQLLPLLRRRLVVDRVLVEEPVVSLVRTESGAMNVDSLGKRAAPSGAPAAGGAAAAGAPAFQLASLRLRHGTLRYRDLSTGRTVELAQVAVDARQPQFDAPVPVAVRARLATADLRLAAIVSEGGLGLAGRRPPYQGSLRAGPGAFGSLAVKQIIAKLHASPPVLDLESATLETLGGTVEGRAHLTSEGKGAGMTAQLDARGLELAQLPAPKDRPRPAGTLEVHGTLAGPPPEAPTFASGATGQGRFVVADGRIEGAGFGRPLLDAPQAFLKPGGAGRPRGRHPHPFARDHPP